MQNLIRSLKFFVALVGMIFFIACGGEQASSSDAGTEEASTEMTEEAVDKSGPEYTSAYICPMHCKGSGSDSEGKCPVCGMAYVANTDHESHEGHDHDGHDHDHDHDH